MILVFTNGVYNTEDDIFYNNKNIPTDIRDSLDNDSNDFLIIHHCFDFEFKQQNEIDIILKILQKKLPTDISSIILSYCSAWEYIQTPNFDRLMNVYFNAKQKKLFYIFLGRIFHHFNEKDNWDIIPIIYGQSKNIEYLLGHLLGMYKLCIGRYGVECLIPSETIWSGLVSLIDCEGTSTRALINTINNLMNNRNHSYGSMYNEQTFKLENPKFIFIPELDERFTEFQFNRLEMDNILSFEFNTVITEIQIILDGIYEEFPFLIRKSNIAYLEACNLYEDKDMLLNS